MVLCACSVHWYTMYLRMYLWAPHSPGVLLIIACIRLDVACAIQHATRKDSNANVAAVIVCIWVGAYSIH